MDFWSIVFTAIFGCISAVLSVILQHKINEIKLLKSQKEEKKEKRERALENGMVCVLRKHLMDEHELWTSKGYISSKALDGGLLMYKAYKDLGGNGMIDHMEEEIQELPIRD